MTHAATRSLQSHQPRLRIPPSSVDSVRSTRHDRMDSVVWYLNRTISLTVKDLSKVAFPDSCADPDRSDSPRPFAASPLASMVACSRRGAGQTRLDAFVPVPPPTSRECPNLSSLSNLSYIHESVYTCTINLYSCHIVPGMSKPSTGKGVPFELYVLHDA